jgi:predicted kinase
MVRDDAEKLLPMKPKATVYVLCGFIGAGKTTFAKKLEEQTGAVRITKDEWLIQMVGNDPTIDGYEDYDSKMCGLSRDIAFQLAAKGIDVIIDEGVWLKEHRDLLRKRAEDVGAQAVVYFLDTPPRDDTGASCATKHECRKRLVQDQRGIAGLLPTVLGTP